ncbi:putative serine/threonine-protein kinase [Aphelenchoides besseyi]|nr:putative serine/threonine-protein kinase [Aphelenchoides besseyi]KAI6198424.1 putative serine/threonine-protein kinase [Aphelenchoides besseyi]
MIPSDPTVYYRTIASSSEGEQSDDEAHSSQLHVDEKKESVAEERKAVELPDADETVIVDQTKENQRELVARLPVYYPGIWGCRSINEFKLLNRISEGTFGVVYRAQERQTDEIFALKQLKMEKEKEGFPITSLREINMLMKCRRHPNVVALKEIVTDSTGEKIYMVMEFVEHDLRALMRQLETRRKRFTLPQVKTLMHQLLSGCAYLHHEWVVHRDLKTANLLLSHGNILKVLIDPILRIGDFGLAREYGNPLKPYTQLVVTLHYRSPELLLGCKTYSTAIDIWSIGCIFGEFFKLNPILPGTGEADQTKRIFELIGTPNESNWPGYNNLPFVSTIKWPVNPHNQLHKKFYGDMQKSDVGLDLMKRLLAPCPERRISAEEALKHQWFKEDPRPANPESFPTWPAKSENLKRPPPSKIQQPPAKVVAVDPERLKLLKEFSIDAKAANKGGFSLKLFGGK